ncbi:MAG: hypothetical protein R3E87_13815 [Burkholderiaceae bacterium]
MDSRHGDGARRRLLLLAAAAPLIAAGCATSREYLAAPAAADAPIVPLAGSRWRYQRINLYNDLPLDEVVCELESTSPSWSVIWRGQQERDTIRARYSEPWRIVEEPLYGELMRFERPVPVVPAVLAAGQRERVQTHYRVAASSRSLRWRTDLAALGWERVVVPAGAFTALRIERTSYFEPWQMSRFSARRVETLWMAPEIGHWVRRDWTGYYLDETTLGGGDGPLARASPEEREEAISWRLMAYEPAPVAR